MKNLLLVLGALVAVGIGALGVVVFGVDLPDRTGPGAASGTGGAGDEGDVAGGRWSDDDGRRGLDAPDPLDAPFDPLEDGVGGEARPEDGPDGRGRKAARRAARGKGDGENAGVNDEEMIRAPGEPDPGGKHLAALSEVLDSGDPEKLRMFLVSTMSVRGTELGEAEAALLIGALGETRHTGLQGAILLHLERIGGESITEGLVGFLKEKRPGPVVARTLEALGRINSPASISALVDAMASPALGRNRRAAADALARTRNPVAIGPLATTLNSPDRSTRQFAAAAIVRIGTTDGYEAVLGLAREGDAVDRSLARRLLEKSANRPEAVAVFASALSRERDAALRVSLARSLGRSRDANATRPLLDAARGDTSPQVRAEAVNSLARVGGLSAYGEVQRIAQEDPHKLVQRAAQRAVKQIERKGR